MYYYHFVATATDATHAALALALPHLIAIIELKEQGYGPLY